MKEVKKLVLRKETITSLDGDEMNLLRGGATYTCYTGTSLGAIPYTQPGYPGICTNVTCDGGNACNPSNGCNPYGGGGGGGTTISVYECGLSYDYCP
jgi:natural product precursor